MCVIIVVFKHLLRHINQSRLSVVSIWSVIYCASSFINYLPCGTYVCMYVCKTTFMGVYADPRIVESNLGARK